MRTTGSFVGNLPKELQCTGLDFETTFVDNESPETLVIVYRVDLVPGYRPTDREVVKFSSRNHAIPNAEKIQFGTLEYYRKYEGPGEGIRDEMEGNFKEDIRKTGAERLGLSRWAGAISGHITWGGADRWLFCTSLVPKGGTNRDFESLGKRLKYGCASRILNPGTFAQELGTAFANNTSWSDVRLDGLDMVIQAVMSKSAIKRVVRVYHGPVHYLTDPANAINSFPEQLRSAVVAFQKRPDLNWQREYRFVVDSVGEPIGQKLLIPIPAGMTNLTRVAWESLSAPS